MTIELTPEQAGIPTGEAKPHALVELYERERQQLVKVAAECVKANVSSRAIELAEGHARLFVSGFAVFARSLGLDPLSVEVRKAGRAALEAMGREAIEGTGRDLPGHAA